MTDGARVRRLHPGDEESRVELWVFGLNHRTAPVELRERLAFRDDEIATALARVLEATPLDEAVLLSTCNRVELVAASAPDADVVEPVTQFFARERGVPAATIASHAYVHRGKPAVQHLFRVASSLDSMMVGEPQILGQLKEQFRLAADGAAASRVLRRCFERSFTVAKRVRSETGVAGKAVSLSSAAVELARRIFDDLGDKTAMLIGAGKMSELAARHFVSNGIASVIVTNRSFDRAVELARGFGGTPVPFERYPQYLALADVVLGSVATSGYILGPTQLHDVLRARRRKPMFFIDLGVPRNFDPAINDLQSVYLYNIDDLAHVADDHRAEREREAVRGEEIVREEAERFWRWISRRDVTPTIVALRGKLDGIRRAELDRAIAALRKLEPDERRALEAMTQAIVNKILHQPLSVLKQLAVQDEAEAAEVAELVHRLFALEAEAGGRARDADDGDEDA
ncbi:MAG: glutamyl-tRNA reductase [Thermodesulfobacteriota bacterium]